MGRESRTLPLHAAALLLFERQAATAAACRPRYLASGRSSTPSALRAAHHSLPGRAAGAGYAAVGSPTWGLWIGGCGYLDAVAGCCSPALRRPSRRTAQPDCTAAKCLPSRYGNLTIQMCREHLGQHPCDKRRPTRELAHAFPAVDFSLVRHTLLQIRGRAAVVPPALRCSNVHQQSMLLLTCCTTVATPVCRSSASPSANFRRALPPRKPFNSMRRLSRTRTCCGSWSTAKRTTRSGGAACSSCRWASVA